MSIKFKYLILATAAVLAACGGGGGSGSTTPTQALYGIAYDSTNSRLFVSDNSLNLIQSVNTSTGALTTVAGGTVTTAQFSNPGFMFAQASGSNTNLFVADIGNDVIREVASADATPTITTYAGVLATYGFANGNIDSGSAPYGTFYYPNAIAVDSNGNYFVADTGNSAIREITGGAVSTIADSSAGFGSPAGIAIDANNVMYVTDAYYSVVKAVFYGTAHAPTVCAAAASANVWNVCTLSGTSGTSGYSNNTSNNSSTKLYRPQGIATDGTYVYVADSSNNAIRQITIATGATATLSGSATGVSGKADDSSSDNGSSARFSFPTGLVYDSHRYLYVVDQNGTSIRKVDTGNNGGTVGVTSTIH